MFDCNIAVKPSIKRYLTRRYGNPVRMDCRSYIGKHFHQLMKNGTRKEDKRIKMTEYTAILHVRITEDVFLRHGSVLTNTATAAFNTYMEQLINDQLIIWTTAIRQASELMKKKGRITSKDSYDSFIDVFGFDDGTFTYDAVKKAHQRHGEKVLSL